MGWQQTKTDRGFGIVPDAIDFRQLSELNRADPAL